MKPFFAQVSETKNVCVFGEKWQSSRRFRLRDLEITLVYSMRRLGCDVGYFQLANLTYFLT